MRIVRVLWKSSLVCLSLLVCQMIAGMIVPMKQMAGTSMKWWVVSTAITAVAITAVALRSPWRGWKLGLVITAIPFAIQLVNLIEGAFFLVNSGIDFWRIMLLASIGHGLVFPLLTLIFRKAPVDDVDLPAELPISAGGKLWRFAVSDITYVFLYYLAGMIIFPFVRDFYATQTVPPATQIIALQELVRAPIFIGICLLLKRMVRLPRLSGALAVGLAFTILSGVAPLISPNPFFPDAVRWVHFCEVVSENFVFATVVGYLWSNPAPALQVAAQPA